MTSKRGKIDERFIYRRGELVLEVITEKINSNPKLTFMNINDEDESPSLCIEVNDKIIICITNRDNLYDSWINELYNKENNKIYQKKTEE